MFVETMPFKDRVPSKKSGSLVGALRPAARAFKVFSQCRKLCVLSVTGPFLTAV